MSVPQAESFRDPSGRVVVLEDVVLRYVHPDGQRELEAFLQSETIRRGITARNVVGTEQVENDEDAREDVLVRHERIAFPSYPYEWPPEMLEAAAVLTLDLQEGLVQEGLGLKDATPYNVLFDGPRPVFVDALSVEPRDAHDPVWTPYGQFIRTFLLPLVVARDAGLPLGTTLLTHRDGLQPEQVHRMTPRLRRLRRPYRSLVTLPTLLAGRAERQGEALYEAKHVADRERVRFTLQSAVRALRRNLRQVAPRRAKDSHWSSYMNTRSHYSDDDAAAKDRFVGAMLERLAPGRVLDVGCNTGHFSAMAARSGASVVAVDLDPVSVGRVWCRAVAEELDILPLVVDLSRPTPAVGWRNRECPSFLERAEGRFDLVLFLAVMHHLHVTERVPIGEILRVAHRTTRRHIVFEYVGPQDPMFRKLLRGRGDLHKGLTRASFEAELEGLFDVVQAEPLAGSDRVLYLLERLDAPEVEAVEPVLAAA